MKKNLVVSFFCCTFVSETRNELKYDKGRNHQQHQECGYNHGEKQHGLLGELVQSLLRNQNDVPDGGNREYERERAEQPGEIG